MLHTQFHRREEGICAFSKDGVGSFVMRNGNSKMSDPDGHAIMRNIHRDAFEFARAPRRAGLEERIAGVRQHDPVRERQTPPPIQSPYNEPRVGDFVIRIDTVILFFLFDLRLQAFSWEEKLVAPLIAIEDKNDTPSVYQKSDILVFSGWIKRSANFYRST
jgi:hypothetical protein